MNDTIKTKLDQLAVKLLDCALSTGPSPDDLRAPEPIGADQQVDIFKCVTAYHLGETKLSAKLPTDDEDTMGGFKKRLAEASDTQGTA